VERTVERILVPVDGPKGSLKAARFVAKLARDRSASLLLVRVYDAPAAANLGLTAVSGEELQAAKDRSCRPPRIGYPRSTSWRPDRRSVPPRSASTTFQRSAIQRDARRVRDARGRRSGGHGVARVVPDARAAHRQPDR
jgi:nucleotide-binding universal stress UspA family protein